MSATSDMPDIHSMLRRQRDERRSLVDNQHDERKQAILSLKERQREERERLILQAAEELFLERGFYETSIDDIAARVGIAKGTVYLHFPSKEELVLALFDKGRQYFLACLDTILSSAETPPDKLRAVLEQVYNGMLGKHFQLLTSVFQNPEFRSRLINDKHGDKYGPDSRWGALSEGVSRVLDEGKASGDFDPSLPTPIMLGVFLAFLSPHYFANLIVRDGMAADEVVSYLSRCLFRAIAAPHSGEEPA
ncbi:MAG: helix-turn-helix domain-containing protein [Ktedonobacterales bacterium]